MNCTPKLTGLMIIISFISMATGCQSVHWNKAEFTPGKKEKSAKEIEKSFGEPARMVVIWKDAVYEEIGKKPARGFGGRFYFYDSEQNPVRVRGELIVYAFDEDNGSNSTQADRKYVFPADELQAKFGETSLGPSYSFWLPWDGVGGDRKSVALIPVLKTDAGNIVRGDQSISVLSGKSPDERARTSKRSSGGAVTTISPVVRGDRTGGVATASYEEEDSFAGEESLNFVRLEKSERRTTVIDVPRETASRMNRGDSVNGLAKGSQVDPPDSLTAGKVTGKAPRISGAKEEGTSREPATATKVEDPKQNDSEIYKGSDWKYGAGPWDDRKSFSPGASNRR